MSNVIPDGWTRDEIAKYCDVVGGGTPDRSVKEYWDGDIPWISPTEVTSNSTRFVSRTKEKITQLGLERSSAKLHPAGSLLMTSRASIGYVAINTVPMATNQGFQTFRCKKETLPEYLYYHIDFIRPELERISAGSTFSEIPSSSVKKIELTLPPLPEQQKIATILSSVDDVIEKTRAQIDKLKDLKTGMMQELLTQGIGHTEFKDSLLGRIPASWDVVTVDEVSDVVMVGVVVKPAQYYVEVGIPALRSANIREEGLTTENLKYFSPKSSCVLRKSILKKGDLLTVRTGYPGTTAVVTEPFVGFNCIDVIITRPSKKINPDYLNIWVNSEHGKGQVLQAQGGLAQQHFNVGDMKQLVVALPSLNEQTEIVQLVQSVALKISAVQRHLAVIENLKKSLMQDLLTGKVRVKVDSPETVAA